MACFTVIMRAEVSHGQQRQVSLFVGGISLLGKLGKSEWAVLFVCRSGVSPLLLTETGFHLKA